MGTTGEPLPSGTAVGADVLRWDHVGLNVADLDRASAWYEQVLGLRSEREFAVPGTGLRGRMLVHSGGYRLELIERSGSAPGIQASGPGEAALTRGFGHMAFQVADLDAVTSGGGRAQRGGMGLAHSIQEARASAQAMGRIEDLADADIAEVRESASLFAEMESATQRKS